MEYTEIFVTKGSGAAPNNGGYPLGPNDGPTFVGTCTFSGDYLTRAEGWAGVNFGDFFYIEKTGYYMRGFVTNISGNELYVNSHAITDMAYVVSPGDQLTIRVGGAISDPAIAINIFGDFIPKNDVSLLGDYPRVNVKGGTSNLYPISQVIKDARSLGYNSAWPITAQGYDTIPGDGGFAVLTGGVIFEAAATFYGIFRDLDFYSTTAMHASMGEASSNYFYSCGFAVGGTTDAIFSSFTGLMQNCYLQKASFFSGPLLSVSAGANFDTCYFLSTNGNYGLTSGPNDLTITNCIFSGFADALTFTSLGRVNISNNTFARCGCAIRIQDTNQFWVAKAKIQNNVFCRISGYGIDNSGNWLVFPAVSNNRFFQCTSGNVYQMMIDESNISLTSDPYPNIFDDDYTVDPKSGIIDSIHSRGLILSTQEQYITPGAIQPKTPGLSRSRILGGV